MPLNSAFPALLVPAFCRAFARFSRRPEGSRGLSLLQPCCGLSVADGRAPISRTLEGFEGLQPQAGFIQTSAPVVCCIMSKTVFSESPGRTPAAFQGWELNPCPCGLSLTSEGKDMANIWKWKIFFQKCKKNLLLQKDTINENQAFIPIKKIAKFSASPDRSARLSPECAVLWHIRPHPQHSPHIPQMPLFLNDYKCNILTINIKHSFQNCGLALKTLKYNTLQKTRTWQNTIHWNTTTYTKSKSL